VPSQSPVPADHAQHKPLKRPPAFNLPGIIIILGAVILAIHAVTTMFLSPQSYYWVITVFAFIPKTMTLDPDQLLVPASRFWSPVTHGLLHGDWTHALVNLVWLSAFGSAVARRFKTTRFLLFMVLATAAGALAHYVFDMDGLSPVIGASGAISACMGAAARFAVAPGAINSADVAQRPALGLMQSLSNWGIMVFVVVWFALNWLFGAGLAMVSGGETQIAWQAHMGGFLFGLLAFGLFDPVSRSPADGGLLGQ